MRSRVIRISEHDEHPIWLGVDQDRRSNRFHMGLAILCVGLAVILIAARYANWIAATNTLLLACAMGLLLMPLVFVDPLHGLMVYAVLAPVSPEADIGGGINIRVQDPLIAVIFLGVIVQELRGRYSVPPLPLKRPLFAYIMFAIFSSAVAFILTPFANRSPDIFYVLKLIQYVTLTLCVALSIRNSRHILMLMGALMIGFAIQSIILKLTTSDLPFSFEDLSSRSAEIEALRRTGIALSEQSNVLGVYLLMMICFTLGFIDRTRNVIIFVLLAILLLSAGLDFLASKSRTAYAPAFVILVMGIFLMRRKWIPIILLLTSASVFAANADFFARLQSIGVVAGINTDSSYESRIQAYEVIWSKLVYADNSLVAIWFGGGRGVYDLSFADTQWGIELCYGGLLGVAIMLVLVLAALHRASSLWYRTYKRDDALASVSLGAFLALIVATISTFGLTSWSAIRTGELIFMCLGLVMACHRLLEIEKKLGIRSRPRAFTKAPIEVAAYAKW